MDQLVKRIAGQTVGLAEAFDEASGLRRDLEQVEIGQRRDYLDDITEALLKFVQYQRIGLGISRNDRCLTLQQDALSCKRVGGFAFGLNQHQADGGIAS